jgi:ribosomal protein L37E
MSRTQTDAQTGTPQAGGLTDADALPVCPACGTRARRAAARYCATCGRNLQEHAYLPADTLRASYHHQHSHPPFMPGHAEHDACIRPPVRAASARARFRPATARSDPATQLAGAFVTYALVPYLGILFCPGALVLSVIGCLRAPRRGHARAATRAVILACAVSGAQVFLWWLLYNIRAISY